MDIYSQFKCIYFASSHMYLYNIYQDSYVKLRVIFNLRYLFLHTKEYYYRVVIHGTQYQLPCNNQHCCRTTNKLLGEHTLDLAIYKTENYYIMLETI